MGNLFCENDDAFAEQRLMRDLFIFLGGEPGTAGIKKPRNLERGGFFAWNHLGRKDSAASSRVTFEMPRQLSLCMTSPGNRPSKGRGPTRLVQLCFVYPWVFIVFNLGILGDYITHKYH